MKKILAVLLMLCSFSLLADLYDREFWDGSYAYNKVRLQEVNDGFELSVTGAYLGLDLGSGIHLAHWQWPYNIIFIKFKNADCVKNSAEESVTCSAVAPEQYKPLDIFVQQAIPDISGYVSVISPAKARKMEMVFKPEQNFKLDITPYSWREVDAQSIEFNLSYAQESSDLGFPERLRNYISQE